MLLLVLPKDGRDGFSWIERRLTLRQIRTRPNSAFRWRFDGRRGTRRWLCVLYWSFVCRPHWRSVDAMCEMFQMGAHILCWCGERFCLWALSGINTGLFLVCILCVYFLKFCNYSLCSLCKLFTSRNREFVSVQLRDMKLLRKRISHTFFFS